MQKAYDDRRVLKLIPTIQRLFEDLDVDDSGTVTLEEVVNAEDAVKEEQQKIMQTHKHVYSYIIKYTYWIYTYGICMYVIYIWDICTGCIHGMCM